MNTLVESTNGVMENLAATTRPATMLDWLSYPDRLSLAQAAFLVGRPTADITEWVNIGAVDAWDGADGEVLVDKTSLRDIWEMYWEIGDYLPEP